MRFNLLAGYVRNPRVFLLSEELEWYEAGNERFLGVISKDVTDNDFVCVVLARDRLKRFRAVRVQHSFSTRKKARQALNVEFAKCLKQRNDNFYQGDEVGEPVDVFKPVVNQSRLHPAFRYLSVRGRYPASDVIAELMHWYEDVDGNFLEQFQTTGFDARLWEMYLYAALIEAGYAFDRSFQAPDYFCAGLKGKFFIEATTVNPTNPPLNYADITKEEYYEHYVPMKFGSALYSKLQKRYWEKEHVKGLPLVIAIQDFHAFQSMTWSFYALSDYLFGVSNRKRLKADGTVEDYSEEITDFKVGSKVVPAGFFSQPGAENISAVIANPGGTIAKFNRIGLLAGFGSRTMNIYRFGSCFRESSDFVEPFFDTVNSPTYSETWMEGLCVYHNPFAKHPLPFNYLPSAGHFFLENNSILSHVPKFFPLGSGSFVLESREDLSASMTENERKNIEDNLNPEFKKQT